MALPGNKNFSDYDNYITDQNPTTAAQAQDYFRNQAELLKAVIDCDFWQPETVYQPGDVVKSDSMPNGTEAVMVATKASVTSNVEPQWGAVGGANISDGACFWKLRWKHWSKEVASVDEMKNGTSNDKLVTPKLARLGQTATNRLPNTAYSVGNVVYVDSNLSVALKCTTAGTTSNTELDISNKVVGGSVKDGSVVWEVVKRSNILDEVDVLPITNGGTGSITAQKARENLNVRLQTFTSLEQLGLDNTATPEQIAKALPENSELNFYARSAVHTNMSFPIGGSCRIEKRSTVNYSTVNFFLYAQTSTVFYYGVYSSYNNVGFSGWKKVITENNFPAIDYSSKISLEVGVANTMASDGYIYLRIEGNTHSVLSYINFTINGITIPGIQAHSYSTDSCYFPVRKGDVIKGTWGAQSNDVELIFTFYKLRGV